jgi:uncharacterized protein (DUF362 family)
MHIDRRELLLGLSGLMVLKGRTAAAGAAPADVGVAFKGTLPEKVSASVLLATGKDPVEFFKSKIKPSDTVGLKLNCLAGPPLAPRPELVEALVGWMEKAGVPANRVIVFDRSDRELKRAGFEIRTNGGGYRCFGTNGEYESDVEESYSVGACFSTILARQVTKLINVGVLKDHDLAGVSVGLKNYYGVIHNPNKYHGNNCSPFAAHLAAHRFIKDRHVLTVADAAVLQYHGGPAYRPDKALPFNAVVSSTDLVACDAWGFNEIEKARKAKGMKTLKQEDRYPHWLDAAVEIGLTRITPSNVKVRTDDHEPA